MTTLLSRVLSSLALCLWSLHPATAFTKDQLDICMVPEAGSLMMMVGDGVASTDALLKHIKVNNVWPGITPYQSWNLTGFYADMLPLLLHNQQVSYRVHVIPTFTQALYKTTKLHECDFAFAPYTHTAARAYCGNETSPEGIPACTTPDDIHNLKLILHTDACCADFNLPMKTTSLGLIVTSTTQQSIWLAVSSPTMVNILSYVAILIVVFAHLVYFAERRDNKEMFPPRYLSGIG